MEKFTISKEKEGRSHLETLIGEIKNDISKTDDFELMMAWNDAVADFSKSLLQDIPQAARVPLYHTLIGSGISDQHAFEVDLHVAQIVEARIEDFIEGFRRPRLDEAA